ncbi:hypothetical protein ACFC09_15405 [Streptomyces sp. NPDC056161]|uniref:hypothetical protein n=1 Tax=Streptomyces sp. NPDC056161 TaxID=3345732 RepID=UPI0035DBE411
MTSSNRRSFTRLTNLTATYEKGEKDKETARVALHEAIIRHLRARNARPGKIAEHTPYDRVWIGELGRNATPPVPPLKGPNAVGPAPKYDPEVQAAALAELDQLTTAYRQAEGTIERTRPLIHTEIVKHYEAGVGPEELSKHTPYDRNWIGEIARSSSSARQRQKTPGAE